jgi:hypothetical protein
MSNGGSKVNRYTFPFSDAVAARQSMISRNKRVGIVLAACRENQARDAGSIYVIAVLTADLLGRSRRGPSQTPGCFRYFRHRSGSKKL